MPDLQRCQCIVYPGLTLAARKILVVEQRQFDILGDVQLVDQIEALEDESDGVLAQLGEPCTRTARDVLSAEPIFAAGRTIEHADDVEKSGFAAARWPHHSDELANRDFQIDVTQRCGFNLGRAIDLGEMFERYHLFPPL